jgi:hypothetical protein
VQQSSVGGYDEGHDGHDNVNSCGLVGGMRRQMDIVIYRDDILPPRESRSTVHTVLLKPSGKHASLHVVLHSQFLLDITRSILQFLNSVRRGCLSFEPTVSPHSLQPALPHPPLLWPAVLATWRSHTLLETTSQHRQSPAFAHGWRETERLITHPAGRQRLYGSQQTRGRARENQFVPTTASLPKGRTKAK